MKIKSLVILYLFFLNYIVNAENLNIEHVFKGIVKISVNHVERGTVQTGSGICIAKDKNLTLILTAGHVITLPDGYYHVSAWQFYPVTKPYIGEIHIAEFDILPNGKDFGIIKLKSHNFIEPLKITNVRPKVGDILYSVGCAHGEWVNMSLTYCTSINNNIIEFSPSAHPGDSGGAIVNVKGEVVGLILHGGEKYGMANYVPSILQSLNWSNLPNEVPQHNPSFNCQIFKSQYLPTVPIQHY